MAYQQHAYVSVDGDWTSDDGADEVWQFGIRVVGNPGSGSGGYLADPVTYMNAIAPGIATWFAATSSLFASICRLRMIKVNNIDPSGHYAEATTHQHDYGSSVVGAHPAVGSQIMSCVVGWLGDTYSRGPAARGRIYMPNATLAYSGAFVINPGDRNDVVAQAKALLAILAIDEPTGGALVRPSIVSRAGKRQQITKITSDTIMDVQRRRKNRAIGARTTVAAY